METMGYQGFESGNEDNIFPENQFEKGIQALSGPLPERLGMLFTADQIDSLQQDFLDTGIELGLLSGVQEEGARDIATLLQNYFEPNNSLDKITILETVKKYLEK